MGIICATINVVMVTTVGKLFAPTVLSGAEGRLNQLTPGIAGTSEHL